MYERFLGKQCVVESETGDRFTGEVTRIEIDHESGEEVLNVDYGFLVKTKNIAQIKEVN